MPKNIGCQLNKQYGRLTIIKIVNPNNQQNVIAKCECGTEREYLLSHLRSDRTKSCGCFLKEKISLIKKIHGLTLHPLYSVWTDIKTRCYNKNRKEYKNYGGRGVTMSEEWRTDFKKFYDWAIEMGWEKGLEIDKDIKGDGKLYSPFTCSIVSRIENLRAKKHTKGQPIKQFFKEDGSHVCAKIVICLTTGAHYTSIKEAAKDINCHPSAIGQVCAGIRYSVYGHVFKYA
jgi:hypothetical protein